MASDITWKVVRSWGNRQIGAVGFIDNKVAVITSFYDDADGDMSGGVSTGEWVASKLWSVEGSAVTRVAMQARVDPDILLTDQGIDQIAKNMFLNFALGQIQEGIYKVYFSQGVGTIAEAIAGRVVTGYVKQYVIKKGMEALVKKAYDASLAR